MFWLAICLGLICFEGKSDLHQVDEATHLAAELKIFEPLVGKTFRGEFANSTPENPMIDVSRWERAMNGKAVRVLHSVNDGMYGGETIVMWDPDKKKLAFWYFTTAGFFTQGTFEVEGQTWTSVEKVTGNEQGISEVRSTSEFNGGKLHVKAKYFRDGAWHDGHEVNYLEDAKAKVNFK